MRRLAALPLMLLCCAAQAGDLDAKRYTGLTFSYQFGGASERQPVGLAFGPLGVMRDENLLPTLLQLPILNVPLAGASAPTLAPVDLVGEVVESFEEKK